MTHTGVASAACSHGNLVSSKLGARVVLECLLNTNLDVDSIPVQEAMTGVSPSATVELSAPVRAAQDVVVFSADGQKLQGPQREDVISTLTHPLDSTHSRNSSLQGIAFSHSRNHSREIDLEAMRGGFLPIDLAQQPM